MPRIRDPLYDIIEFEDNRLQNCLWEVVQTPSFQRLRRIKQLGFSDYVYPGATHSRFAHSLGVFYTAKKLISLIEKMSPTSFSQENANCALAAALVHDIGHGPFSHAFESVGRELDLPMATHEFVSGEIIRTSEIGDIFNKYATQFSDKVAELIQQKGPSDIYSAVISSQFDADRLDYMQRDRIMAGTKIGAIDFSWLLDNLEIGKIPWGDEIEQKGELETFILNSKAIHAAEAYVLGLFQLYPTVYFHKATRCLELIFKNLLMQLFSLVKEGKLDFIGISPNHPLVVFAQQPNELKGALSLDDSVILGALPQLMNAKDSAIKHFSQCLYERRLYKCYDISKLINENLDKGLAPDEEDDQYTKLWLEISSEIREWLTENNKSNHILLDFGKREPYKHYAEDQVPLNQIRVVIENGQKDISIVSPIINAIKPFRFYRIYVDKKEAVCIKFVDNKLGKWRSN